MKSNLAVLMAGLCLASAAHAFFGVEARHTGPPARGTCTVTITYEAAEPRNASVQLHNPIGRGCTEATDRVAVGSVVFGLLAGE